MIVVLAGLKDYQTPALRFPTRCHDSIILKSFCYSQDIGLKHNEFRSKLNLTNGVRDLNKDFDEKKKPNWLEELSRKQASRKNSIKADSSSKSTLEKPNIPEKPRQIKEDGR